MAQPTQEMNVNGVPVDQLGEKIDAIRAQPHLGRSQYRVKNRWVDGGHDRIAIDGFYVAGDEHARAEPFALESDEPPVLLGHDLGPNPVEYALAALSACLTTSIVYHAAMRGVEIRSIESRLEGDLDLRGFLGISEDVRNGYEQVRVLFKIDADAPPETLDELCAAGPRYSPVHDIFTNRVPVTVEREG